MQGMLAAARRALREPLIHFLLLGLLIFVVFDALNPAPDAPAADTITITDERVAQLAAQFSATWRRDPTPAELSALIDGYVREEVFYREAQKLGLDRDDAVIRQRLRLKMEFLVAGIADQFTPDDATLQSFYQTHRGDFEAPAQVSFRQLLIPDDTNAAAMKAALAAGAEPEVLGRSSLLPGSMADARPAEVDGVFGTGFFAALEQSAEGAWTGPLASAFGEHLVLVENRKDPELPPLEQVRDRVTEVWRAREVEDFQEKQYQRLRSQYTVLMPGPVQ